MTDAFRRTDFEEQADLMRNEIRSCDRCIRRCTSTYLDSKPTTSADPSDENSDVPSSMPGSSNDGQPPSSSSTIITAGHLLDTTTAGSTVYKLSQKIARAPRMSTKRRHTILSQGWTSAKLLEKELENLKAEIETVLMQKICFRQTGVLDGTSDEFKDAVASITLKHDGRKTEVEHMYRRQLESLNQQLNADLHFEDKVANDQIDKLAKERLSEVETKLRQMGCVGPDFELKLPEVQVQPSSLCKLTFDNQFASGVLPVPSKIEEKVREAEKYELQSFLLFGNPTADSTPELAKKFTVEIVPPAIRGLTSEFMSLVESEADESE